MLTRWPEHTFRLAAIIPTAIATGFAEPIPGPTMEGSEPIAVELHLERQRFYILVGQASHRSLVIRSAFKMPLALASAEFRSLIGRPPSQARLHSTSRSTRRHQARSPMARRSP